MITLTPSTKPSIYLVDGKFVGRHIRVVREFPDVFLEELPGMPQIRKLSLLLIAYLGPLLFQKGHTECQLKNEKKLRNS
jgi:hypothetical protein